jgi:hypothetical protein
LKQRISNVIFEAEPIEIKSFDDPENKKIMTLFAKDIAKDVADSFLYIKKTAGRDFILTREVNKAAMPADKVLTMFRAGSEPVTRDNMTKTLMFNEMTRNNLDQMRRTLESVFIPAFS